MNVLGKIKSKRQNASNTQVSQMQEKLIQEKKQQVFSESKRQEFDSYQSQIPQKKNTSKVEEKKIFRTVKPVQQVQYIKNTNVMTKQKQSVMKQKQQSLMMTSTSPSNTFFTSFQTYKPSKNLSSGVYFDSNHASRSSTFLTDSNTNQQPKHKRADSVDSYESQQEMNVDFDFLLSNKDKKEVKKSIHQSKGKIQNQKQIQRQLKTENQEVLCFYLKKWAVYGDVFMLEGELQSIKKGYIQMDLSQGKRKVYNKIKIKLSCGRDVLSFPETIGRIYFKDVSFLSQTEGMITHQYFLRAMQKSKKIKK